MSYIELEILSESKINREICSMYWELDEDGDFKYPVSKIAKYFDKTTYEITKKIKKSCIAYAKTIECHSCGTSYVYKNRTDYQSKPKNISLKCEDCIETEKLNEKSEKQSVLDKHIETTKKHPFSLKLLTFTEAVYLLSIIRYQIEEDLTYLKSYASNQTEMLSPRHEYDIEIYRKLINKNIIAISPITELDSVSLDDEGNFNYRIDQACWEIIIDENKHPQISTFIEELENKLSSMEWEESWYDEAKEFCKDVALQESLAYLDSVMSEHQFNFVAGEKTILVINKILENHSVAQLYNLIWGCAKDAAAYYMRSNIPKNQAANSVIGGIERKYERYITNGWEIKPFRRNFNLPISVLSQVLYGTTLHTDDGGFHKPLSKII